MPFLGYTSRVRGRGRYERPVEIDCGKGHRKRVCQQWGLKIKPGVVPGLALFKPGVVSGLHI